MAYHSVGGARICSIDPRLLCLDVRVMTADNSLVRLGESVPYSLQEGIIAGLSSSGAKCQWFPEDECSGADGPVADVGEL